MTEDYSDPKNRPPLLDKSISFWAWIRGTAQDGYRWDDLHLIKELWDLLEEVKKETSDG